MRLKLNNENDATSNSLSILKVRNDVIEYLLFCLICMKGSLVSCDALGFDALS